MFKIKRNDIVYVTTGKDRGKKGKVLLILSEENRAIVEGINLVSKYQRRTRQDQPGGIAKVENPVAISNLMLYCKACDRGVRVGVDTLKDGSRARICKKCKEAI